MGCLREDVVLLFRPLPRVFWKQQYLAVTCHSSVRSADWFVDFGHIIGKIHAAETLLHSENQGSAHRWNISMWQEVCGPADDSKTVCPGFTSVGTENTITLVDVTINLLHELSDLCPEDQTQEIFRCLLRGMSAVLSDSASVMKSFGGSLDEERWRILQTDEELQLLYCNAHCLLGLGTVSK